MEKPNGSSYNGKQRRRKIEVKGGGFGGLLLVGGAIATAALISAIFASKSSNKKRHFNKSAGHRRGGSSSNKFRIVEEEADDGLLCILQIPSPSVNSNLCCRSSFERGASGTGFKAQINSVDSTAVEAKIMEDSGEAGGNQKSDDDNADMAQEENRIENYLRVEAMEEIEGDQSSKMAFDVDQMIFKDNPLLQLLEQEDSSEEADDVDEKKREEGSEATNGDFSLESNSESIWPAGLIAEESSQLMAIIMNQIQMITNSSGEADDAVDDDHVEVGTIIAETKMKMKEFKMTHKLLLCSLLALLLPLLLLVRHIAQAS